MQTSAIGIYIYIYIYMLLTQFKNHITIFDSRWYCPWSSQRNAIRNVSLYPRQDLNLHRAAPHSKATAFENRLPEMRSDLFLCVAPAAGFEFRFVYRGYSGGIMWLLPLLLSGAGACVWKRCGWCAARYQNAQMPKGGLEPESLESSILRTWAINH